MQTRFAVSLTVIASLLLVGCKKDDQINSVLTQMDAFTNELVNKIDSASNPSAGVDEAQKFFDSRKADLTSRMATLKDIRGYQVSEETKKKMTTSLVEDAKKVASLQAKYVNVSMRDPVFKSKLDKLIRDYQDLFKL